MKATATYIVFVLSVVSVTVIGVSPVAAADGVVNVALANGINARIVSAEYLSDLAVVDGTRGVIDLGDGEYLSVITDINDPVIANKGDGSFHPYDLDEVVELLDEIDYPGLQLDVDIYLLPFPRSNVLVSSVSGSRMYLSPLVSEVSRESSAYVIAHEVGHVFQNKYMPRSARSRWNEYRRLRNILDTFTYAQSGLHANRPDEIFAEDFRVLFGGRSADFGGYIENPNLPTPTVVSGLRQFFAGLATGMPGEPAIVSVVNYPNPFNPDTRIRVHLRSDVVVNGEALTIRVYDVRGALVRELYNGTPAQAEITVQWDGRDNGGRSVASSTYFGVAESGGEKVTQKLLMIK